MPALWCGCPKEQKILWAASCRQSQKQQLEGIGRVQGAAESWEGENTECGRAKERERWRLRGVKDCGPETAEGKKLQKAPAPAAARVLKAEGLGTESTEM